MIDFEYWRTRLLKAWRKKFQATRLDGVHSAAAPSGLMQPPEVVVRKYGKWRVSLLIHKDRHSFIFFRRHAMPYTVALDWPMQQPELLSFLAQTLPIE